MASSTGVGGDGGLPAGAIAPHALTHARSVTSDGLPAIPESRPLHRGHQVSADGLGAERTVSPLAGTHVRSATTGSAAPPSLTTSPLHADGGAGPEWDRIGRRTSTSVGAGAPGATGSALASLVVAGSGLSSSGSVVRLLPQPSAPASDGGGAGSGAVAAAPPPAGSGLVSHRGLVPRVGGALPALIPQHVTATDLKLADALGTGNRVGATGFPMNIDGDDGTLGTPAAPAVRLPAAAHARMPTVGNAAELAAYLQELRPAVPAGAPAGAVCGTTSDGSPPPPAGASAMRPRLGTAMSAVTGTRPPLPPPGPLASRGAASDGGAAFTGVAVEVGGVGDAALRSGSGITPGGHGLPQYPSLRGRAPTLLRPGADAAASPATVPPSVPLVPPSPSASGVPAVPPTPSRPAPIHVAAGGRDGGSRDADSDDEGDDGGGPESLSPGALSPRRGIAGAGADSVGADVEAALASGAVASTGTRTRADAAAFRSVDDHIASRVGQGRSRQLAWSWHYQLFRIVTDRLILTVRFVLSALLVLLGVLFLRVFPDASFGQNPAYKWLFLVGCTAAVMYPLEWAEGLLFLGIAALTRFSAWLREAGDFLLAAKGHLSHIGAVTFALLLKTTIFQLSFSVEGEFYFVRTCAALLFIKLALIVRNLALKAILRALYRIKHNKQVADVLFYVETARALTGARLRWAQPAAQSAPAPDSAKAAGGRAGTSTKAAPVQVVNPAADAAAAAPPELRVGRARAATPTHLLEGEAFWAQASYVKEHRFTVFDGEGSLVNVVRPEAVAVAGGDAFDRLHAVHVARERRRLKEAIVTEVQRDVADRLAAADSAARAAAAQSGSFDEGSGTAGWSPAASLPGLLHAAGVAVVSAITMGRASAAPAAPRPGIAGAFAPPPKPGDPSVTAAPRAAPAVSAATSGPPPPGTTIAAFLGNVVVADAPRRSTSAAGIELANRGVSGAVRQRFALPSPTEWTLAADPFYCAAPGAWWQIADVPDMSRWERLLQAAEADSAASEGVSGGGGDDAFPLLEGADGLGGEGSLPPLADPATALANGARINLTVVELERLLCELDREEPSITFHDVAKCFRHPSDALAAFRLLDLDCNGRVTRSEFANSLAIMLHAWQSTKTSLASYGGISGAIRVLTNIVYWVVQILIVLAIYEINFNSVWAPLSALLIAFGFSIGPTLQRTLDSLMLVLIISPFDVGDKVSVPSVAGGSVVTVMKIYLTATEFTDGSNKRLIARNADLIGQTITNLRRSGDAAVSLKWVTDAALTLTDLEELKAAVEAYVMERAVSWKPAVTMTVTSADSSKVEVGFALTHRSSWNDSSRVTTDQTDAVLFITRLLRQAVAAATAAPSQPSSAPAAVASGGSRDVGAEGVDRKGVTDGSDGRRDSDAGDADSDDGGDDGAVTGGVPQVATTSKVADGLRRRKPAPLSTGNAASTSSADVAGAALGPASGTGRVERNPLATGRSFRAGAPVPGGVGSGGVITTRGGGLERALGEGDESALLGIAQGTDDEDAGAGGVGGAAGGGHRTAHTGGAALLPLSLVSTLLRWPGTGHGSAEDDSEEELTGTAAALAHRGPPQQRGSGSATRLPSMSHTPAGVAVLASSTAASGTPTLRPATSVGSGGASGAATPHLANGMKGSPQASPAAASAARSSATIGTVTSGPLVAAGSESASVGSARPAGKRGSGHGAARPGQGSGLGPAEGSVAGPGRGGPGGASLSASSGGEGLAAARLHDSAMTVTPLPLAPPIAPATISAAPSPSLATHATGPGPAQAPPGPSGEGIALGTAPSAGGAAGHGHRDGGLGSVSTAVVPLPSAASGNGGATRAIAPAVVAASAPPPPLVQAAGTSQPHRSGGARRPDDMDGLS